MGRAVVLSSPRPTIDRVTLVEAIRAVFSRSPVFCNVTISQPSIGPGTEVMVEVSFDHAPPIVRVVAPSEDEAYAILYELASIMVETQQDGRLSWRR